MCSKKRMPHEEVRQVILEIVAIAAFIMLTYTLAYAYYQ